MFSSEIVFAKFCNEGKEASITPPTSGIIFSTIGRAKEGRRKGRKGRKGGREEKEGNREPE